MPLSRLLLLHLFCLAWFCPLQIRDEIRAEEVVKQVVESPTPIPANSQDLVAAAPTIEIPFELQPYRVLVSVAFADTPGLDPYIRGSILRDIVKLSDRYLGEMWTVTTEENARLIPVSKESLVRLTENDLPDTWRGERFDKSFLITLEQSGCEYHISGREWDHVGRILGPTRTQIVVQRRELSSVLFRLVHDLFRPLLTIDRVTDGSATVTVKGGGLAPADPAFVQLRPNQFWQPFLRFRNVKNEVEKLDVVPWTLLQIDDVSSTDRAHGTAQVVSGLRSPLPARRRPRIDLFARAVQPDNASTEFRLVSNRDPGRPLVGVVVELKSKKDAPPTRRLLTDRNGMIRMAPNAEQPLVWLFVRSGERKLAQLPVIPGMEPRLTAELPDDSIRLRVEGELSILESNLTDTVAQRAVLMARIRKLAGSDDWKAAKELQKELQLLPTTNSYLQELSAIRLPAVKAAQIAKDKSTVASVERICGEASRLIQKYLDEDKLKSFDAELIELERETKPTKKKSP